MVKGHERGHFSHGAGLMARQLASRGGDSPRQCRIGEQYMQRTKVWTAQVCVRKESAVWQGVCGEEGGEVCGQEGGEVCGEEGGDARQC